MISQLVPEKISPETRSRMMAGIRGGNTKPERLVRSGLHAAGFRFRLHRRGMPGRPDLVLPRWHVAVFVHGCFWHGHAGCPYFRVPKTRTVFWTDKISRNSKRDRAVEAALRQLGWRVATVWECALRHDANNVISQLVAFIQSAAPQIEIRHIR